MTRTTLRDLMAALHGGSSVGVRWDDTHWIIVARDQTTGKYAIYGKPFATQQPLVWDRLIKRLGMAAYDPSWQEFREEYL